MTPTVASRLAIALATGAAALVALFGDPADAHAVLVATEPERDGVQAQELDAVVLEFNEPIPAAFAEVQVVDPEGERVDQGGLENTGDRVIQPLGSFQATGVHTVRFRVVSADGHPVEGEWTFVYEGPVVGDEDDASRPPVAVDESAPEARTEPAPQTEPGPEEHDGEHAAVEEPLTAETTAGGGGALLAALGATALLGAGAGVFLALRRRPGPPRPVPDGR